MEEENDQKISPPKRLPGKSTDIKTLTYTMERKKIITKIYTMDAISILRTTY